MAFIDQLGLVETFLLLAAVVLTYVGVVGWYRIRTNNANGLRQALRGSAIPVGGVGFAATALALWGEMTWNYQPLSAMGGYNILFTDIIMLFGLVMIAYAVAAYMQLHMQYVGLFALVAGAVTLFYGWTGYGFQYTKEPLEMLLLYAGFGVAGISAFPATLIIDHFLVSGTESKVYWTATSPSRAARGIGVGVRGAQSISPKTKAAGEEDGSESTLRFRVPGYLNLLLLAFPVLMGLAAIAAFFFLGSTIPGHLTPGKTP